MEIAKPAKSLETQIRQRLESAVDRHRPRQGKKLSTCTIERSMAALGVNAKFVAKLLTANPEPDIETMTREEIEAWMQAGLPVAAQMPNELLESHISRLLSQLVADSEEIKTFSADIEFMTVLARLSPRLSIFSLCPVGRAFVLYLTKTLGVEATDDELIAAALDYRPTAEKLKPVIEYEGISFALQDSEIDWIEFFTEIIGD